MYTIISPRLGTPGDEYIPENGVNIDALLDGGLISTDSVKKSSKVKSEPKEQSTWLQRNIFRTQH